MTQPCVTLMTVYRAMLNGECRQVGKDLGHLRRSVRAGNAWHTKANAHKWSYVGTTEVVTRVSATAYDWSAEGGCGGIHLHYACPHCQTERYGDDDLDDTLPFLWYAECCVEFLLVDCPNLTDVRQISTR